MSTSTFRKAFRAAALGTALATTSLSVIAQYTPPADNTTLPPMSFADLAAGKVPAHDTRTLRVMEKLKLIPQGRALFDYAVQKNVLFVWDKESEKTVGLFDRKTNTLSVAQDTTDDNAVSVLLHELRHAWQTHDVKSVSWFHDPLISWQAAQINEVDACAFSAQAMADYKQITQKTPEYNIRSFNTIVATDYAAIAPEKRDFKRDAIEPCFEQVRNIPSYEDMHHELAQLTLRISIITFNEQAQQALQNLQQSIILSAQAPVSKSISPQERARMFRVFFTTSLSEEDRPTVLKNMNDAQFVSWLDQQTLEDTKYGPAIREMQSQYEMKRKSVEELQGLTQGIPPLSVPANPLYRPAPVKIFTPAGS